MARACLGSRETQSRTSLRECAFQACRSRISCSFISGVSRLSMVCLAQAAAARDLALVLWLASAYPSLSRKSGARSFTWILDRPVECSMRIVLLPLLVTVTFVYVCVPAWRSEEHTSELQSRLHL